MWQVTHDMGHLTCECDTWHLSGGGRWTISQHFSSLVLMVWEWRFDEDIFTNHDQMIEIIYHECDFRTPSATLGLLIKPGVIFAYTRTLPKFLNDQCIYVSYNLRICTVKLWYFKFNLLVYSWIHELFLNCPIVLSISSSFEK